MNTEYYSKQNEDEKNPTEQMAVYKFIGKFKNVSQQVLGEGMERQGTDNIRKALLIFHQFWRKKWS